MIPKGHQIYRACLLPAGTKVQRMEVVCISLQVHLSVAKALNICVKHAKFFYPATFLYFTVCSSKIILDTRLMLNGKIVTLRVHNGFII